MKRALGLASLVLLVAAAGASSGCGGKSIRTLDDDASGAASARGGGVSSGGAFTTGGVSSGGTAGTSSGGTGDPFDPICGEGGFGGSPGSARIPVRRDTAALDCSANMTSCLRILLDGCPVTATRQFADCPLDQTRPVVPEECDDDERWLCHLAWSPQGQPMLVNCECEPKAAGGCGACFGLLGGEPGPPLTCNDREKVCGCAE